MSQLIDKLNRVDKALPQPMGFRAARPASAEPQTLLIASLSQRVDAGSLSECIDGADAVLLRLTKSGLSSSAIQKTVESLPDIPWGYWLDDTGNKKIETLVKAGCDFTVIPATSRVLAAPQDDTIGKILQVESSLSDGLLRAVNDLPVDAVLAADMYDSIDWHHLMHIQHMANLLSKPLLVPIPLNLTASEIKLIWEAGVDGVVAEVDSTQPSGALKELRQTINKLPPRSRKRGKAEVLLPYVGEKRSTVAEDEEEEEE